MNEEEIRKRVRARLADGTLPRQVRVAAQPLKPGQPTPEAFTVGSALGDPCAVCGERATNIRYNRPDGPLAFHHRCEEIWRDEASKPIRRG